MQVLAVTSSWGAGGGEHTPRANKALEIIHMLESLRSRLVALMMWGRGGGVSEVPGALGLTADHATGDLHCSFIWTFSSQDQQAAAPSSPY